MRTPRGDLPPSLLMHFVRHRRSFIFWSYDSLDYQTQTVEALASRPSDDIVLMHDDPCRHAGAGAPQPQQTRPRLLPDSARPA
ncbi:MAG: hypothetical protein WDW38_006518 [Sanguina aurantia]